MLLIHTGHGISDPELYQNNLHLNRAGTNKLLKMMDAKQGAGMK